MIKKILLSFLVLSVLLFGANQLVLADAKGSIQCGVNAAAGAASSDCSSNPKASSDFTGLVAKIVNIMSVLVGAVAVVMIIVAGFRFVASAGNETAVAGAKKTIVYSLVGLLIVAVAQAIVHFVLNNLNA